MILNWDRYTGTAEEFDDAAKELLHFVQKDIRGRITRRYVPITILRSTLSIFAGILGPLLGKRGRWYFERKKDFLTATGLLESYYSRLYKHVHLDKLPVHGGSDSSSKSNPAPELRILGTNITRGTICSFTGNGFLSSSKDSQKYYGKSAIKVSQAVAASSAHPGFFSPLHLTRRTIRWELEELATEHQYIADAGVCDNLGLSRFLQIKKDVDLDLVLVSDATGGVDLAVKSKMRYVIGSTLRTLEIITGQQTKLQKEIVYKDFASRKKDWTPIYLFIEISATDENSLVPNQTSLKSIRTDLDRFSKTEIFALTQHGYAVSWDALSKLGLIESDTEASQPRKLDPEWPLNILQGRRRDRTREHNELMNSSERKLGMKGFFSDWLGWVYVFFFVVVIPSLTLAGLLEIQQFYEEKARVERVHNEEKARVARVHNVERFRARPTVIVKPREYPVQETLESPDNSNFVILEDTRYFDLRKWKAPPSDTPDKPFSPVTMIREIRAKKNAVANYMRYEVRTSGSVVYLQSNREKSIIAQAELRPVGERELKVRHIVLDVSDVEVGDEFTLVYEATYYDAFADSNQWWAGILAHGNLERSTLVAVFRKDRPFTSLECVKADAKTKDETTIPCDNLSTAKDSTYAYWEIDRPTSGFVYQLKWTW